MSAPNLPFATARPGRHTVVSFNHVPRLQFRRPGWNTTQEFAWNWNKHRIRYLVLVDALGDSPRIVEAILEAWGCVKWVCFGPGESEFGWLKQARWRAERTEV